MKIISPIILLLFLSCPSHITRFVVSIIIDPVKCMFGRWFSAKRLNKFRDRSKSEFNPATAIVSISLLFWIITAFFCSVVAAKLWRDFVFSAFTVSDRMFAFCFFLKASARLNVPCREIACAYNRFISAVAAASPSNFAARRFVRKAENGQTVKALTRQVFEIMRFYTFSRCHNA